MSRVLQFHLYKFVSMDERGHTFNAVKTIKSSLIILVSREGESLLLILFSDLLSPPSLVKQRKNFSGEESQ